jgi:hypothetical protein
MPRSRLLVATLASLVLGLALMIPFESALARVFGIASLVAFIVCGTFLIANPVDLGRADDDAA